MKQDTSASKINSEGKIVKQSKIEFKEDTSKLHKELKSIVSDSKIPKPMHGTSELSCFYKINPKDKKIKVYFGDESTDGCFMAYAISKKFLKIKNAEIPTIYSKKHKKYTITLGAKQLSFFDLAFEECFNGTSTDGSNTLNNTIKVIDITYYEKQPEIKETIINNEVPTDNPDTNNLKLNEYHKSNTFCSDTKRVIFGSAVGIATSALGATFVVFTKAALTHTAIMLGALSISPVGAAVIAGITVAALIGIVGFSLYKVYQRRTEAGSLNDTNKEKLSNNPNIVFEEDKQWQSSGNTATPKPLVLNKKFGTASS